MRPELKIVEVTPMPDPSNGDEQWQKMKAPPSGWLVTALFTVALLLGGGLGSAYLVKLNEVLSSLRDLTMETREIRKNGSGRDREIARLEGELRALREQLTAVQEREPGYVRSDVLSAQLQTIQTRLEAISRQVDKLNRSP